MTKADFMGQFDRLCRGFKYDATSEQAEAWFRRIGHALIQDWSEAVTTLLCAPRFPLLDPVLAALEVAAAHRRRTQIERDKQPAATLARLAQDGGRGCPLSLDLFQVIKAFAGREQVRHYLAVVNEHAELDQAERERELKQLATEERRLSAILTDLVPKLNEEELSLFVDRYGQAVAS